MALGLHDAPNAATAAQVRLAKTRFLEDRVRPSEIVPETIVRSWERSRAHGLMPRDKTLFRAVASPAEARAIAERERRLIDAVTPEVARVAATLQQPKTIVFCTDAEGILVHALCDHTRSPRVLREPLRVGRSIAEAELGTTAPGCVLAELSPIMITGEEHFLAEVNRFACAAAPIFDFDGSLAGVVDVTGVDVVFDATVAGLVAVAARASEQRLFASGAPGIHVSVHGDARFLQTPLGGKLALSESGRILGACSSARRSLGVGPLATFIHDVVHLDASTLLRQLHDGSVVELRTHDGSIVHAVLDDPPRARAAVSPPPSRRVPNPTQHDAHDSVGSDPVVRVAYERASLAFARDVPLLITGETGTGKEVLARKLHERYRPNGPFVAINCTAIPEGLIEAELFGFVDGSFTGARRGGAVGRLASAAGGTLFLDEIGDMDLRLQARLLQFLQGRTLSRVGDTKTIRVDCAVLAATHRDLEAMIATGSFREDLYHRINGLLVELPPLRERADFDELLERFVMREAGPGRAVSREALAILRAHRWRGNVRELEQAIRTAVALSDGGKAIGVEHLPVRLSGRAPFSGATAPRLLEDETASVVRRVLAEHGGNVSAAARALGISRGTLYKRARARS